VDGAVWAEPDQREAVAQLRRLADDAAERAALGARARRSVMARLDAGPLANAMHGIGLPMGHSIAA
jgi:hypothetical protein